MRFIEERLGVPMVVRYGDAPNGVGLDPEQPIVLRLDGVSARSALEQTLEQAGAFDPATWQVRRGFIEAALKG